MVTIKDVAKKAGVSPATVSNILNDKYARHNETYKRVMQCINELNYRPSYYARNLRKSSTSFIGVILPDLNDFYANIYNGISSFFLSPSTSLLLKLSSGDPMTERKIIDTFISMNVTGIILVPSAPSAERERYEALRRAGIPFVLVERDVPGLSADKVLFDNEGTVYSALMPLRGVNMCMIRTAADYSSEDDAEKGFLRVFPEGRVISVSTHRNDMFTELYKLLVSSDLTGDHFLTTSSHSALVLSDVLASFGRKAAIYALTGNPWNLTRIHRDIIQIPRNANEAGKTAAEWLLHAIRNREKHNYVTVHIDKISPHRSMVPDFTADDRAIRVLCLRSTGSEALKLLSLSLTHNHGIRFEFDEKEYQDLRAGLDREMAGEHEYDILMIDKPWLQKCYDSHLLRELGSDFASVLFLQYPSFIQKVFYENRFRPYCIPFIAGIQVMRCRIDVFEDPEIGNLYYNETGTPLIPPKTWQQFNTVVKFFTDFSMNEYHFRYGTLLESMDPIGLVNDYLPRQWSFRGSTFDAKGLPCLDTPENERALRSLRESFLYSDPAQFGLVSNDDAFASLLKGEIPLAIGYSNHFASASKSCGKDNYERLSKTYSLPGGHAMVGGYLLGISRQSTQYENCREFLRYVMSDHASVANMRMKGYIPTMAVYNNPYLSLLDPWMHEMEKASRKRCTRETARDHLGNEISMGVIDRLLTDMIKRTLTDEADCRGSLRDADSLLRDIVRAN